MCGRNFADDRIEKHEEICSKTADKAKKRKVFDMTKARVKGTDAAKYVKSAAHLEKKEAKVWIIETVHKATLSRGPSRGTLQHIILIIQPKLIPCWLWVDWIENDHSTLMMKDISFIPVDMG